MWRRIHSKKIGQRHMGKWHMQRVTNKNVHKSFGRFDITVIHSWSTFALQMVSTSRQYYMQYGHLFSTVAIIFYQKCIIFLCQYSVFRPKSCLCNISNIPPINKTQCADEPGPLMVKGNNVVSIEYDRNSWKQGLWITFRENIIFLLVAGQLVLFF